MSFTVTCYFKLQGAIAFQYLCNILPNKIFNYVAWVPLNANKNVVFDHQCLV